MENNETISDKGIYTGQITLIENKEIISDDLLIAETLNSYFDEDSAQHCHQVIIEDEINNIIEIFKPS